MSTSSRSKSSSALLNQVRLFFSKAESALGTERKAALNAFSKRLSIKFNNLALLDLAFHHRSFSNEQANSHYNNERLEFLGDAVLGLSVASYLYVSMVDKAEGELAKIKAVVVSEQTLSKVSLAIGVDQCLVLGKGEEHSGGRTKKAILADALEALIGAYYLDSGYDVACKLVLKLIEPEIRDVQENRHVQDCKSLLQEYYQKTHRHCPVYDLVKKTGPEHDRTFWVSVNVDGTVYGPEAGKNKKAAEQAAARRACTDLHIT